MKKTLLLPLFIVVMATQVSGQEWYNRYYPDRTLADLDYEELSYLKKQTVLPRVAGPVISLVGLSTFMIAKAAFVVTATADALGAIGFLVTWDEDLIPPDRRHLYDSYKRAGIAGIVMIAAGIPVYILGKSRQVRLNPYFMNHSDDSAIQISPGLVYNNSTFSHCPVISFTITF